MYSRCCAVASACISIFAVEQSFADTVTEEIQMVAHHVWIGHANQTVTRDGSVLNEFIAETASVSAENAESAVLSVSMIPRFTCVPIISIEISDSTIATNVTDLAFTMVLDSQEMDYPSIHDTDGEDVLFTLSSTMAEQRKLLSTMDVASWATFRWVANSTAPELSNNNSSDASVVESDGKIDFSLLGSQKTITVMEEMCRSHAPLPLTN